MLDLLLHWQSVALVPGSRGQAAGQMHWRGQDPKL